MIGGNDIVIPTTAGLSAVDFALRACMHLWPNAVFEDARTGECFTRYAPISLEGRREFLVYRDRAAADQWRELGADDSLIGTMVHLLTSASGITVVVDSIPSRQIQSLVSSIRRGVRQDIFEIAAMRSAA